MEVILVIILLIVLVAIIFWPSKDYQVIPSVGPGEVRFDGRSIRRVFRTPNEKAEFMKELKVRQKEIIEDIIRNRGK
jgi:hypothetical protein